MNRITNPTRRLPEQEELLARYDAGELTFGQLHALWAPMWDTAQLRKQQAEAVATAVLFLGVQS